MLLPPKDKIASLDIHAQKTFTPLCPNELPVAEGHLIVEELNAQAQLARYRIGSKEAHNPKAIWVAENKDQQLTKVEGKNVDVRWVPHSVVGSKGFELLDGLPAITDYDFFIWEGIELDMHPYGVCYHDHAEKLSTGVIEFLRAKHITHVIVGGLATDYCVKVSVLQLLKAGFSVIVNLGACRGLAATTTQKAIDEMHAAGATFIERTAALAL